MAPRPSRGKDHIFRVARPPAGEVRKAQSRFAEAQAHAYRRWAAYRRSKHVVQDALADRVFGGIALTPRLKAALDGLRATAGTRVLTRHEGMFVGPPIFQTHPGINVIAPPYDFGLNVALGSNKPAVIISLGSGTFSVVASASSGTDTFGSAGIGLFIVPSAPARTLAIRPYFQYEYSYSCESHGPPTAHSIATLSANASGRTPSGASQPFPGRDRHLWSASSDAWDDAKGWNADVFPASDAELTVSGFDFYTLSYVCQASADSHAAAWWWSESWLQLHCRVPFIVVEES